MNEYATKIGYIAGVVIFFIVAIHLWISLGLSRSFASVRLYVALLALAIGSSIVWGIVGVEAFLFFGFCSSCFGPGSPQQRVFYSTFDLPFEGYSFILIIAILYACSLALLLFMRAKRFLPLLTLGIAALVSAGVVGSAFMRVNLNPDGIYFPIPANARQLREEATRYAGGRMKHVTYFTSDQPEAVLQYYDRELPKTRWVPLYSFLESTPVPTHVYWRSTADNKEVYLHVMARGTGDKQTFVDLYPNNSDKK